MVRKRAAARLKKTRSARAFGAIAIVLAVSLSACSPRFAELGLVSRPAAIEGDRYITRDGLALGLQHWDAKRPRAIIVALHGMGDYSNAFAMPAKWFVAHRVTIYAYDQRGFGRSPNTGMWAGGDAMRRDLVDFVEIVRSRYPGIPTFALGESMGGAVLLSALATDTPPNVDGAILVAPAVWGWRNLPFSHRAALWTVAHSFPWQRVSGEGLGRIPSDNIEMLRELARDPLFQHRARTDALYGLVTLMDDAYDAAPHVKGVPVLMLYGEKDQVIPREPTEAIAHAIPDVTVHVYPNGYHMLMRDLQAEKVWKDIVEWTSKIGKQTKGSASAFTN